MESYIIKETRSCVLVFWLLLREQMSQTSKCDYLFSVLNKTCWTSATYFLSYVLLVYSNNFYSHCHGKFLSFKYLQCWQFNIIDGTLHIYVSTSLSDSPLIIFLKDYCFACFHLSYCPVFAFSLTVFLAVSNVETEKLLGTLIITCNSVN